MRSVFPIYLALAKQLEFEIPFGPDRRTLPVKADPELFDRCKPGLNSMDQRVMVHQLRHLLQMTTLNASEGGLRALILRHLRKPAKSTIDRDKIDFLLVQYFALCAPAKIYHKQIDLADAALVMQPVLGEVDTTPLAWCEPLEKMIESLQRLPEPARDSTRRISSSKAAGLKNPREECFTIPSALLAFIRFNFLLRRTLDRADARRPDRYSQRTGATGDAGIRFLDWHARGFSGNESITRIKQAAEEWKQPFQREYTERTVSQAFDKLLGLRADVEQRTGKDAPQDRLSGQVLARRR